MGMEYYWIRPTGSKKFHQFGSFVSRDEILHRYPSGLGSTECVTTLNVSSGEHCDQPELTDRCLKCQKKETARSRR